MNVTNISQLATTATSIASGVSKGIGVVSNFTQPFSGGQIPTAPLKNSIALASSFAANLGSTAINTSALSSIADNVVGSASSLPSTAGSITSAFGSEASLSSATEALVSGGALSSGLNAVSDEALSSVANAAFGDGASALGDALGLTGEGALGLAGEQKELSVADIYDPANIPTDWVFITAPQDVSWDKQAQTSVVDNFGTNNPYVVYSSTGMRKLSLGEVLIEGFSAGKEVESHVLKLEAMMNMVQNSQKGYVSPYVWDLRAGDKSYGKFIIESLQIKENMRNAKGRADRATASISLQQVPDFQVNDGRDLATKADLAAGKSVVSEKDKAAGADNKGGSKVGSGSGSGSGANGDKTQTPSKPEGARAGRGTTVGGLEE